MKTKSFDKENLGTIRADINAALATVAKKHGITLAIGNISFTTDSFTTKLSAAVVGEGQSTLTAKEIKHQKDFKLYAGIFGLSAEDLGKRFLASDGKHYTIAGARPKAKQPLLVSRDGKTFVCGIDFISKASLV